MCGPIRQISAVVFLIACCQCGHAAEEDAVIFYAMGDVPYSAEEDRLLPQQIAELPDDGLFVVHVGDIKNGSSPCDAATYQKVAGMLGQSRMPTFVIPGDNEWNDCADPDFAWDLWEQNFSRFDDRWHHRLPVFRQLEREENFSFAHRGVLFIGINLVGSKIHNAEEWRQRLAQNVAWTRSNFTQFGSRVHAVVIFGHANPTPSHDAYINPLCELAAELDKPILYLHGDGHRWVEDRPFAAENILRVQVDQGGIAPPVKVTVTRDADDTFRFDRRKSSE